MSSATLFKIELTFFVNLPFLELSLSLSLVLPSPHMSGLMQLEPVLFKGRLYVYMQTCISVCEYMCTEEVFKHVFMLSQVC